MARLSTTKVICRLFVLLCTSTLIAGKCHAGYARFNRTTDTISVAGNSVLSNSATYEARVMFSGFPIPAGTVYYEWRDCYEDKSLSCSQTTINAMAYPLHHPNWLTGYVGLSTNTWYHIAYVYDGSEERLYLNGNEIASRATTGTILNDPDSITAVGCLGHAHDGGPGTSFIGLIDTIRISTVARYSGTSFYAPTGDLAADQYTNLLYNFNEPVGSSVVKDLSGNGRDGTLGIGFPEATSPELVPEPSSFLALLCGVAGIGGMMWRRKATRWPGRAH